MGNDKRMQSNMPDVTVEYTDVSSLCALYLVIMREMVIGIPEETSVRSKPKTVKVIWYIPIPSEPIALDR